MFVSSSAFPRFSSNKIIISASLYYNVGVSNWLGLIIEHKSENNSSLNQFSFPTIPMPIVKGRLAYQCLL